jgi:hypothetical protein
MHFRMLNIGFLSLLPMLKVCLKWRCVDFQLSSGLPLSAYGKVQFCDMGHHQGGREMHGA